MKSGFSLTIYMYKPGLKIDQNMSNIVKLKG